MSPSPTFLYRDKIVSPIGEILLISDGEKLCGLDFADYAARLMQRLAKRYGPVDVIDTANPQGLSDRLQAYLQGDLHSLDTLPVSPGGTPFQQQVWSALRRIPVGTVLTYGQLAMQLGKPTASRAVGMANALNPVAIALPCHRVIGANRALTGYAGGLLRKQWLLAHEGVDLRMTHRRQW